MVIATQHRQAQSGKLAIKHQATNPPQRFGMSNVKDFPDNGHGCAVGGG